MKSIEQKLKEFILSKYKSIREFCFDVDMPYSTVDSIFKRGISNASVTNIIKICNKLNISVDLLANGKIGTVNCIEKTKNNVLNKKDQDYIKKYRSLNENGKNKVDDYMNFVLSQPENVMYKPDFNELKKQAEELADDITPLVSNNSKSNK